MATLRHSVWILVLMSGSQAMTSSTAMGQAFTANVTVTTGNRPSVSLIQDTSGGHSAQSWELFGSEVGIGFYDVTSDKTPFFVWSDAPNHGLVVANNGAGFGIPGILPDTNLHVHSADLFTTLRLETSTQAWDLSGGALGFDLVDHTNSDAIPFTVRAFAPTDSLYIDSNGNLGMGTSNPQSKLHLKKSSTPGIRFEQTTPAYAWDVDANQFGYFIANVTTDHTPFVINASSPDFALAVGSTGDVGLGTTEPMADLHLSVPDAFATLRMEASGGTWDTRVDNVGYVLNDVVNGTAPFAIDAGAPSNALLVSANGNVGLGTANPTSRLHARQSAITGAETFARFEVSDDAVGRLDFNNATSSDSSFIPRIQGRSGSSVAALITEGLIANDTGGSPVIVYNAAKISGGGVATRPLVVYRNNNVAMVTVAANGNVTAASFINASSRELKDDISDLDSAKASAALRQLTPVEFTYKNDATREPRVGFIAEDVPDLIAEPERKSVPVMDVVAVLTRVVKDQQQTIDGQQNSLNRQAEVINDLTKRLVALERSRNAGE